MRVIVYPNPEALAEVTVARLCVELADATCVRQDVHVALAGGSVGTNIVSGIADSPLAAHVDWGSVHVWWVDERFLPHGHEDRNDHAVQEVFAALPIPADNIHPMPSPQDAADAAAGARAYARELARWAEQGENMPVFDVVLLGMGPDGHVASLFPHHRALAVDSGGVDEVTVALTDSPKPPPERVSLSLAAVNNARKIWVAAWGAQKAAAVAGALSGAPVSQIPAAGVRGQEETLWLTDLAGAAELGG